MGCEDERSVSGGSSLIDSSHDFAKVHVYHGRSRTASKPRWQALLRGRSVARYQSEAPYKAERAKPARRGGQEGDNCLA